MAKPSTPEQGQSAEERQAFGELLRTARQARKLSQAALAKLVNISAVFVSQLETGMRLPSDRVAKAMAIALDLPWEDVLRRVYEMRSSEAQDLFANHGAPNRSGLSDLPAIRSLLLQLAGLDLSTSAMEALVRKWTNDLTLVRELREASL